MRLEHLHEFEIIPCKDKDGTKGFGIFLSFKKEFAEQMLKLIDESIDTQRSWNDVNADGNAMIITRSMFQQVVDINYKLQMIRPIPRYHIQLHVADYERLEKTQERFKMFENLGIMQTLDKAMIAVDRGDTKFSKQILGDLMNQIQRNFGDNIK